MDKCHCCFATMSTTMQKRYGILCDECEPNFENYIQSIMRGYIPNENAHACGIRVRDRQERIVVEQYQSHIGQYKIIEELFDVKNTF